MPTNEFLPFGTGAGANVLSPAAWAARVARATGFQAGTAKSAEVNTALRQAAFMAAMVAKFTADNGAQDVLDDGDLAKLVANFARVIRAQPLNYIAAAGAANALTITLAPPPASYSEIIGTPLQVKFASTNTGAATINVNNLGSRPINRPNGEPVLAGDLIAGRIGALIYDGATASFQLTAVSVKPIFSGEAYRTAGAFSTVLPLDARLAWVVAIGAGGGGGGASAGNVGTGGGGGEYREGVFEVTPGATLNGVVGAGGAGGNSVPNHGSAGGSSSFGSLITANGGSGGGSNNNALGTGGNGGSGGFFAQPGRGGWQGAVFSGVYISGTGGAPWGGVINGPNYGGAGAGSPGAMPGAGGNGGSGATASSGGVGAAGMVIIRWLKGL